MSNRLFGEWHELLALARVITKDADDVRSDKFVMVRADLLIQLGALIAKVEGPHPKDPDVPGEEKYTSLSHQG
jgi:hypothetical protein